MYLQITTKCNMSCAHCCYSCTMRGKHAEYNTVIDMILFARDSTDCIAIGGGEPTLHPRFFDILEHCLEDFDSVWVATNGSQTKAMHRLSNIIDQENFPECDCAEELGEEEFKDYGCLCHEKMDYNSIYQEDKLSVALSLDCFHDPIDNYIEELWTRESSRHTHSHFEIRDVDSSRNGVIAQGRAKKTGSGWNTDSCVCSDIMLKIDGKIRMCGCNRSPVIGNIKSGIEDKWTKYMEDTKSYQNTNCYFGR